MWDSNKENVCNYFGYDRHGLRTLLDSKNANEEDALWEFLTRSAQYLKIDPKSEVRIFPLKKPSFPLTPIEVFQKTPPIQRRKLFFESCYLGDIFYLKVIEEKSDCFKLLALDKYKGCMKIDDLGIVMDLPKLPQELKHLYPYSFFVIKAALSSCNMKERNMCVTLDKSVLKPEYQDVSLGPVYESYSLPYHGNPFLGISFTDNLFMTGEIRVRNRLPELSIIGIKEKTEYSHQKKTNKRVFSKSLSRTSLRKRLLQETASYYYKLAVASADQGQVRQALTHLKQALYIWNEYPEALVLAGKCFNIAFDTPYTLLCTMETFEKFTTATAVRKQMSSMLVEGGRVHLNYNNKSLARDALEMARILDPDSVKALRLLKDAKLLSKSSINPDEKYEFPCPFQDEVDVGAEDPEPRPKRKHHKRKTSKKKHQKHHKSSKLSLSPKNSSPKNPSRDVSFKAQMNSKFKSQFSEPLPSPSELNENEGSVKMLLEMIENFSKENTLSRSFPFNPCVQANPNIPEFAVPLPVQTSSASTPHESLKTLTDLVETAKREIYYQNQLKASKLTQPSSEGMSSEDTAMFNTILSSIISFIQDLVKNSSPSPAISESLPLLQSQLLRNQLLAQYPVNQVLPQIQSPHPTQTFFASPLCPVQPNQALMFPLPVPENFSNVPPKNCNSLNQSIVEEKTSVEPNSESKDSIPFLDYPVSTPGHSKHSNLKDQSTSVPVYQDSGPLSMLKTKYFKPLSPGLNEPDMASDYMSAAEKNAYKSETPLPDSTDPETIKSKKNTSPEVSRRTPQRYRLTPPKKQDKSASTRHRSRSPRKKEGGHSLRKGDKSSRRHRSRSPRKHRSRSPRKQRSRSPRKHRSRSPRKHRSRSPRKHRSRSPRKHRSRSPRKDRSRSPRKHRSRSPRKHRSRSPPRKHRCSPKRRSHSPRRQRSRSHSPRRYRSRSSGRSRSRSYSRSSSSFKRSRSNSVKRYRKKVHVGKRSPSPHSSSLPRFLRGGPFDSSSANLCEVVVSSPSYSDSSMVSNFHARSPSPCVELTTDVPPESPFLQSTSDFLDPEISLVGFHRSESPPWQRHVSISSKPARHKASSSSSLYPASKSYSATSSKDSSFSDDRSLSPPKRAIPVICSRNTPYK